MEADNVHERYTRSRQARLLRRRPKLHFHAWAVSTQPIASEVGRSSFLSSHCRELGKRNDFKGALLLSHSNAPVSVGKADTTLHFSIHCWEEAPGSVFLPQGGSSKPEAQRGITPARNTFQEHSHTFWESSGSCELSQFEMYAHRLPHAGDGKQFPGV